MTIGLNLQTEVASLGWYTTHKLLNTINDAVLWLSFDFLPGGRASQFNILQPRPLPMAMGIKKIECRTCRRGLEEGTNVLEVQEGIIGKLGFVALGEKLLFCNFECLRNYLDGSKGHVLERRIP